MATEDLTGVVLAGGESTRFADGDKALATLDGRPLVAHVLAALRTATGRDPVLVARDAASLERYVGQVRGGVRTARDDPGFDGPLGGLLGGLPAVDTDWAFLAGCDMPGLSPAAVGWLAAHREPGVDAVAVREPGGVRESLHAVYRVAAVERAAADLEDGAGPRAVLDELSVRDVPPEEAPADVDLAASLANVNTRADLRAFE